MEPFVVDVGNGDLVSGLKSFPLKPEDVNRSSHGTPLIICLHGSSYCAKYFDAHQHYSIRNISEQLSIPVIALNRPGYKQTPQLGKTENTGSDTHLQNEALWLHRLVLPAVWRAFGPPFGATSIVLMGHGIGGAVALIASSLSCTDPPAERTYPLGGLILTGMGTRQAMELNEDAMRSEPPSDENREPIYQHWNMGPKTKLMLNSALGHSPLETIKAHEAISCPALHSEHLDFNDPDNYPRYWRSMAAQINVPVMYFLADMDLLWDSSVERIGDFTSAFLSAPRVESGILRGAGHCIELSWLGPCWYLRCAGFATCCAVEKVTLDGFQNGSFVPPAERTSLSTVMERASEV
ncbi:hypothetical protein CERZMDRAFT_46366 [Cercospora zeae-maydis SCOH1-5]|uniref:AB hydrolase-1 domain-containing protein n=1 Tax=Cercospora zeae-maydis SCOH1-5 TaxID=717836 RepID=A0A6A6F984_9PEZI|nr:hypothetical protein CERZMDRAFT_46366 [Cercospora zeae-maydis SCOH1-5]